MFISARAILLSLGVQAVTAASSPFDQPPQENALAQEVLGSSVGTPGVGATYDYVIVGGGTGGLTLASRLSENSNITVAVIEAGGFYEGENPIQTVVPAGTAYFTGSDPSDSHPQLDWGFVTAPQEGANGREIHYTRGKCLGGSSARNYMIYQRGTKGCFDQWAAAVGDQSYTFDALLPYFKKSVTFTAPGSSPSSSRFHNSTADFNPSAFSSSGSGGGPLQVSYPNYAQPFSTWLEPALKEIGVDTVKDFNSGELLGCQYCSCTIDPKTEKRASSQNTFLKAAKGRRNLKVYYLSRAKKVVFNDDKKATGVVVASDDVPGQYVVRARKEVILSAGAFQSPQLLMVSGIGPKDELEKFGIPVIKNLPGVGQGMQDHVFFGPTWRVNVPTLTRLANDPQYLFSQFAGPYSLSHQGPLTNPGYDFLGWEKLPRNLLTPSAASDLAQFPADWPDLEYVTAPSYAGNSSNPIPDQPKDGYQYASILGALVAPMSRGNVTITSGNTDDLPIINPNWMTHPTDASVAVATFKRLRAAFDTAAMNPVLLGGREYYPGDRVQGDGEILDFVRDNLHTVWHASCTCKMGRNDDPLAVVDADAKVFGVKGLRVVDASAFALLPPGHPVSMVYALAEKIAERILEE